MAREKMRRRKEVTVESLLAETVSVGDCKEWTASFASDGYGRLTYNGNPNSKAHRVIYMLCHPDEDIKDRVIRHTCDNIRCINPAHLLSGTPTDNAVDKCVRGRDVLAKLTRDEAVRLRELYATGKYTQKELGEMFNINSRTANYAINYKTYKWTNIKET